MRWPLPIFTVLTLVACGDDDTPTPDVGVDAGAELSIDAMDAAPSDLAVDASVRPDGPVVFVSSATFSGDSVPNASATCRELAETAGLGGAWHAWISTPTTPVRNAGFGAGPWYRIDGELAFSSPEDFERGPAVPINLDENGALVEGEIWSGSRASGAATGVDCLNWQSYYDYDDVTVGDIGATDGTWSDARVTDCSMSRRVLCFEDSSEPFNASLTVVSQWNELALNAVRRGVVRPTVVSRDLYLLSEAMYDAWASFEPTANALSYQTSHEPNAETQAAAVSYAAYFTLEELFSKLEEATGFFQKNLERLELSTRFDDVAEGSAMAIGRAASEAVLEARSLDGSNQRRRYRDTSSDRYRDRYDATNDADPSSDRAVGGDAFDPNRWTPIRVPTGVLLDSDGAPTVDNSDESTFVDQSFLTPHWGNVRPFAIESAEALRPPAPPMHGDTASYTDALGNVSTGDEAYRAQFTAVLEASAELTDRQKVIAEFWADGPRSEAPPGHWNQLAHGISSRDAHGIGEDVRMYLALNGALMDAGIATWECKRHFDYIRPVSAIHFLYGDETVSAWAGPGRGTGEILGRDWRPYQDPTFVTPPFPEYVSGHSTFSRAAAEVLTRFTGSDVFFDGETRTVEDIDGDGELDLLGQHVQRANTNLFEPSPAEDVVLEWPTFVDAADEAGASRIYGGIHIQDGDLRGRDMGAEIGAAAFQRAEALWSGR
ncbi:MAG: vanadium-dependent haloperoxidase [Myxococcota bacterium]